MLTVSFTVNPLADESTISAASHCGAMAQASARTAISRRIVIRSPLHTPIPRLWRVLYSQKSRTLVLCSSMSKVKVSRCSTSSSRFSGVTWFRSKGRPSRRSCELTRSRASGGIRLASQGALAHFRLQEAVGFHQGCGVLTDLLFQQLLVANLVINVGAGSEPLHDGV